MQYPKKAPKVTSRTALQRRAHKVAELLRAEYHSPRHSNPDDPLDDLVFILLSTMTTGPSYERVYKRLRESIGSWEIIADMDPSSLAELIHDAGLSNQKAPRIIAILRRIQADFGTTSLATLHSWNDAKVEEYLLSLPGVGLKTAKCVMMYTLGRSVLPVDTHVMRLALRLGLLAPEVPYSRAHETLETVVAPGDRFAFHVNALAHGRAICQAKRPRCESCCLQAICPYPHKPPLPPRMQRPSSTS